MANRILSAFYGLDRRGGDAMDHLAWHTFKVQCLKALDAIMLCCAQIRGAEKLDINNISPAWKLIFWDAYCASIDADGKLSAFGAYGI